MVEWVRDFIDKGGGCNTDPKLINLSLAYDLVGFEAD
jgi:hypothetical protein